MSRIPVLILLCLLVFTCMKAESKCRRSCGVALASYYVWEGSNLTYISDIFNQNIPEILRYNPNVTDQNSIPTDSRINVPFSCDCLNGDFLGHTFRYTTQIGDTYGNIATQAFANLTNVYWLQRVNTFDPTQIPDFYLINVTVNCSCGDRRVSKDYGLFETYPLRDRQNVSSVAIESGVPPELLERFNPGANFSAGTGLVYVPARG